MTRFTSFARSISSADPLFCLFAVVGLAAFVLPTAVSAQTNATTVKDGSNNVVLQSNVDGGLYVPGTFNTGTIPATGAGTRLMWDPSRGAFRAGQVVGTQWDPAKVGAYSVAFGRDTKASGSSAVAMGRAATATTGQSLSIGECNSANTSSDNTLFVAGNGSLDYNTSSCISRLDALVLDKSGNLSIDGVFESGPTNSLFAGHFQGSKNGDAFGNPSAQVVLIENTSDQSSADVLALQGGSASDPGGDANYVSFYDGDGGSVGAIEGNGSGGVQYKTSGSDYAEELPMRPGAPTASPRDLVAVHGGAVSLDTDRAQRLMIVTDRAAMTGNVSSENSKRRVPVAFVGQVPAQVRGTAEVGDLIVASGREDGTARAVAPSEYRRSDHGPIAGQAWSAKSSGGIGEVTVAVGLGQNGTLAKRLQEQQARTEKQNARIADLESKVASLKAENEASKKQRRTFKKRLARLESKVKAQSNGSVLAGVSPSGLWTVLLVLGAFGAGLLWQRRADVGLPLRP